MNIFQNKESFMGGLDSRITKGAVLSLFQLAKQIQLKLGKEGHLLDDYLSMFFEVSKNTLTSIAAVQGYIKNMEFQDIFLNLLDGTNDDKSHFMYKSAEELFEKAAHKLPFQDKSTKLYLLMLLLADEMMITSTTDYVNKQIQSLNGVFDEAHFRELYIHISNVVGESMMEELNQKLKQGFLLVPIAAVYAQSMTNDLLYTLNAGDCETNKRMFQLFMDILPDLSQEQ